MAKTSRINFASWRPRVSESPGAMQTSLIEHVYAIFARSYGAPWILNQRAVYFVIL